MCVHTHRLGTTASQHCRLFCPDTALFLSDTLRTVGSCCHGTRWSAKSASPCSWPKFTVFALCWRTPRTPWIDVIRNRRWIGESSATTLYKTLPNWLRDIGHGGITTMRLSNPIAFFAQILLGFLLTPCVLLDCVVMEPVDQPNLLVVRGQDLPFLPCADGPHVLHESMSYGTDAGLAEARQQLCTKTLPNWLWRHWAWRHRNDEGL